MHWVQTLVSLLQIAQLLIPQLSLHMLLKSTIPLAHPVHSMLLGPEQEAQLLSQALHRKVEELVN